MKKEKKRFSLIELMVVVGIIGALSAIMVAGVMRHNEDARRGISLAILEEVAQSLRLYRMQNHRYPSSLDVLQEGGEYALLEKEPIDGWGNPLVYLIPGQESGKPYDLFSLGSDGEEGGEGYDEDLYFGKK